MTDKPLNTSTEPGSDPTEIDPDLVDDDTPIASDEPVEEPVEPVEEPVEPVEEPVEPEQTFTGVTDGMREYYSKLVDEKSEGLRATFMTLSPGQVMEYEVKADEAARYFAMTEEERNNAPKGTFPFAEEDAEDDKVPIVMIMGAIQAARKSWEFAGAKISTTRKKAKRIVKTAETKEELDVSMFMLNELEIYLGDLLNV